MQHSLFFAMGHLKISFNIFASKVWKNEMKVFDFCMVSLIFISLNEHRKQYFHE